MRTLWKLTKWLLVLSLAAVVLVVGLLLGIRTYRQHANTRLFAIDSPNGINESGYVRIGGIDQWVQIRGQNRDNPVLLCLHGGPGGTWLPVTRLFSAWERDFTVVFWDQRGAGKTLKSTGPAIASTMSVERMAQDGIELSEHLTKRLGKKKIILLGHSFGSLLGVRMVKTRPELFHAFVGTGQVADLPRSLEMEYARLLEEARKAGDVRTQRALVTMGPPPFKNMQQVVDFFEQVGKYQPAADNTAMDVMKQSLLSPIPDYSLSDEANRFKGFSAVPTWALYEELLTTKLSVLGPKFDVPVFIIQGSRDPVTPYALAEEYFKAISAPSKELVALPDGGHFAVWSQADVFLKELMTRVRPTAL